MMEFRCRVCSEMRPNEKISVKSFDHSAENNLPEGTVRENYKYCNDRPDCVKAAVEYKGESLATG